MTTVPTATFSGDAYAQLAMLAAQADEQDRSIASQTEDAADLAADEEEQDRVTEMRAKAQDAENAALATGIGAMAGGACGVIGALLPCAGEAGGDASAGASTGGASGGAPISGGHGSRAFDAGSRLWPGVGGIVAGVFTSSADGHDAAAAKDEAQAEADVRQATRAHDDLQAARSSLDKVSQVTDEIQQSENASRLAAVSVRG